MRGCQLLLLCLLASGTAGCLLFTDPINTAPSVSITAPSDAITTPQEPPKIVRSKTAFTAEASDPDQSTDSLRFDWYQGKTCDKALGGPPASRPLGHVPFPFQPTELGTGCVAVVVTDNRGATATATLTYEVVDQTPIAVIEIQQTVGQPAPVDGQPYPLALYSEITLSGKNSKDPDDDFKLLTFIWNVYAADGTQIVLPGCPDNSKGAYVCTFSTTTPGSYLVKLVVSDGSGKQSTAEQAVQVAKDQLPHIVIDSAEPLPQTSPNESPLLLAANQVNTFTINHVEDDGDPYPTADPLNPYPAPPAGFVWFFRLNQAGLFQRWIGDGPTFTIPTGYCKPQQTIQVRVEYHDRVTGPEPKVFATCDPNATICYSSDFRVQWVTWTVTFR